MPALTHNRVKNGFSGPIRKNNAVVRVKNARVMGATNADVMRKKAIVGGIGSLPRHIRAAYNRRVNCGCKPDIIGPVLTVVTEVNTPSTIATPSYTFNTDEGGTITSNYPFTPPLAVTGPNTITFNPLPVAVYAGVWVNVTDVNGNVSNTLSLASFTITI